MSRRCAVLLTCLAGLLAGGAIAAQEPPSRGQLWALHQEAVKPSMLAQYEAVSKEFAATVAKYRPAGSDFGYFASVDERFVYTFAAPIKDWNGLAAVEQSFMAIAKSVGVEKWADLEKRGYAPVESVHEFVVVEPAGLSYKPANPRLKPEEKAFAHFDFYFVMPGHEQEADAIARDFVALATKKGLPDGYTLFKGLSGPELPVIAIRVGARDAADYYATNAKTLAAFGAEGQALFARAFAITRRFESHNSTVRPDLSVPPPAAAMK